MNVWKLKIHLITEELFQFTLGTYLVLLLIETLQEGFVSYFFNLHLLLFVIILNGLVVVMTYDERLKKIPKNKKLNKVFIAMLTIGSAFLIYHKTNLPGLGAIVLACVTALIIFFLSLLSNNEKD